MTEEEYLRKAIGKIVSHGCKRFSDIIQDFKKYQINLEVDFSNAELETTQRNITGQFVYILKNSAVEGVYKVGMTVRSPHIRLSEINRGAGVIGTWSILQYFEVENARESESMLHRKFAEQNIDGVGTEHFRLSKKDIEKIKKILTQSE